MNRGAVDITRLIEVAGVVSLFLIVIGSGGHQYAEDATEPLLPGLFWAGVGLLVATLLAALIAAPVTDLSRRRHAWTRVPVADGIDRTDGPIGDRSVGNRPVHETVVDDRRVTLASDGHEGGAVGSLLTVETGLAVDEFVRCEADLGETDIDVPPLNRREPVGTLTADGDEGVLRLDVRCPRVPTDSGTLREFASTVAGVAESIERDGLSTVEWSSRTRPRPGPSGAGATAGSEGEDAPSDGSEPDGEPP